eukprot:gene2882-17101_t
MNAALSTRMSSSRMVLGSRRSLVCRAEEAAAAPKAAPKKAEVGPKRGSKYYYSSHSLEMFSRKIKNLLELKLSALPSDRSPVAVMTNIGKKSFTLRKIGLGFDLALDWLDRDLAA